VYVETSDSDGTENVTMNYRQIIYIYYNVCLIVCEPVCEARVFDHFSRPHAVTRFLGNAPQRCRPSLLRGRGRQDGNNATSRA